MQTVFRKRAGAFLLAASLAASLAACPAPGANNNGSADGQPSTAAMDGSQNRVDAGTADAALPHDAGLQQSDGGAVQPDGGSTVSDAGLPADAGPGDAGGPVSCTVQQVSNAAVLTPQAGELFYMQVGLGGLTHGEAALGVGPDGTVFGVDVGNNAHDDDVTEALDAMLAAMPAGGFAAPQPRAIHVLVLTHHHADHEDGLADLLGNVTVLNRIIHRGLTDVTNAANPDTVEMLCSQLLTHPALDFPLCVADGTEAGCPALGSAGCTPASSCLYPAAACPGLMRGNVLLSSDTGPSYVPLGAGARLALLGANATMGGVTYQSTVGPLLTEDSNGENARSVVALLSHGPFRMVLAGDLTGGGSDTDPVEGFVLDQLAAGVLGRGVDVMHASHHGRNTSSSKRWLDAWLPPDGRPRHVVMGISTAHLGSPHAEVVNDLGAMRLGGGGIFATRVATGGAAAANLWDAQGGTVRVLTQQQGAQVLIQAVTSNGTVVRTLKTPAVARCL